MNLFEMNLKNACFSMQSYWSAQLSTTHLFLQHYLNTRAAQSGRRVHVPSTRTGITSKHRQREKRLLRGKAPPPSVAHRPGSFAFSPLPSQEGSPPAEHLSFLSQRLSLSCQISSFYCLMLGPQR